MIKAKKSLGQNFLKDESILNRIIEGANLTDEDTVIEIGPGMGALTERLAKVCKKVIAIELDDRLVPVLQAKFMESKNPPVGGVEIVHGDILKINLPELLTTHNIQRTTYKVVANLPYYITSPILRLLLETKYPPSEMILMVQKEVAERIVAKSGEMSILAVSVQYYADPEYLFTVPKTAFDPVPKVDSAIIKITYNKQLTLLNPRSSEMQSNLTGQATDNKEETKKFFRVVRAGFSAKRKTLMNNLSNGLQLDKSEIEEKLGTLGYSGNTRAQELGVEDWKKLVDVLE